MYTTVSRLTLFGLDARFACKFSKPSNDDFTFDLFSPIIMSLSFIKSSGFSVRPTSISVIKKNNKKIKIINQIEFISVFVQ